MLLSKSSPWTMDHLGNLLKVQILKYHTTPFSYKSLEMVDSKGMEFKKHSYKYVDSLKVLEWQKRLKSVTVT